MEAGGEAGLLVAGGDYDGEARGVGWGKVVLGEGKVGDGRQAAEGGERTGSPGEGDEPGCDLEGQVHGRLIACGVASLPRARAGGEGDVCASPPLRRTAIC